MSKSNVDESLQIQDFIFYRELSEIYLLLDHISGRWDKSFYNGDHKDQFCGPVWLRKVCQIGWPPSSGSDLVQAEQAEVLLCAKDKLNAAAKPANGASIAFTLMVIGGDRKEEEAWTTRWVSRPRMLSVQASAPKDDIRAAGDKPAAENDGPAGELPEGVGAAGDGGNGLPAVPPPSRIALAHIAFPGLVELAASFTVRMRWLIGGLLVWLFFTCLLSWNVAAGNVILGHMDAIHAQRKDIEKKIADLESKSGASSEQAGQNTDATAQPDSSAGTAQNSRGTHRVVRFCEQSLLLVERPIPESPVKKKIKVFHDADELHLCDARKANDVVHDASSRDLESWLGLWSSGYQVVNVKGWSIWKTFGITGATPKTSHKSPQSGDENDDLVETKREVHIEQTARIVALVLGGSVLPLCYGILGAGATTVRDLWTKMRESMLSPRDFTLAIGQLALGATIGACIGLFVTPSGGASAPVEGALVASWGLSASALSFVAGFGVEGVFSALESLVRRIFNSPDPARRA